MDPKVSLKTTKSDVVVNTFIPKNNAFTCIVTEEKGLYVLQEIKNKSEVVELKVHC